MKRKNLNIIIFSLIPLLTAIAITTSNQSGLASQTQVSRNAPKIPIQLNKKQQSGSNRGRPTRRRGMGSRNGCPATNIPLTALIPENKVGKVVEANPTFWLFIPYQPSKIPINGEFVLQDEADNNVYQTDLSIDKGEGIYSISLPVEKSLETDKIYQWYFKLYCKPDKSSIPIYVRGWVQRVALQPLQQKQLIANYSPEQRFAFYVENDIWYSALTELAQLKQANPDNRILAKYWLQLLNNIDLKELSNKPIIS
ncbi:DUF928 domain-containing protein [Plectonema cf. radiosum LEGE 06105]|uniref:DUF928 domain-containing protein n=1 Tax=Plectonema cf. radiosum LEGE 06105 TaxID=945769 RepID=A0A8J7K4T5_9CYAN|nr:DUF928 domain-containing protein [Plectonema radiosum]MBE9216487.1 DUF928 domain-containing protein [Plectonema cf. radiosum LEGE 06105]